MRRLSLFSTICFTLLATAIARCGDTGRRLGVGRDLKQSQNGCVVEYGVDYQNDNPLNDGHSNIVSSPEECCEMCTNFPGCETWVMIMVKTMYHEKGECWFKGADVKKADCIVCASGVKPKSEPVTRSVFGAAEEGCLELPGVDFKGGDIEIFKKGIPTASDGECCDWCQQIRACKIWTRTKSGKCFLKNVQSTISICRECTASGVIKSKLSSSDLTKLNDVLDLLKKNPRISPELEAAIVGFSNTAGG